MDREARSGFDGASEDMDGEDDAHSRPSSVLWERHFEQSIIVDISDDDSLHFSDMQGAFTVHLSQDTGAHESPQLTGRLRNTSICMKSPQVFMSNYNGTAIVFAHSSLP